MTVKQRISLVKIGVDIEAVLDTFCDDEETYLVCLQKFVKDANYDNLIKAIEEGNPTKAFEAAHSLKGVTGNLGFTELYEQFVVITEVFRAGKIDYDPDNLSEIKRLYKIVTETIESL